MKEYDIEIITQQEINFMPESTEREILQNVITICTTVKGSVPMDRDFGISPKLIDEPVNVARARISSEIIQAVRKYEPRARVTRVRFKGSNNENLTPHVKVRILI